MIKIGKIYVCTTSGNLYKIIRFYKQAEFVVLEYKLGYKLYWEINNASVSIQVLLAAIENKEIVELNETTRILYAI